MPQSSRSDALSPSRINETLFNTQAQKLIALTTMLAALLAWAADFAPALLALPAKLAALLIALAAASIGSVSLLAQGKRSTPATCRETLKRARNAFPSLLGVAAPLAAIALLLVLVCAITLALGRLPWVGPVLLALGIPLLAVLAVACVFALALWWLIAAPAVASGLDGIAAHCATLALLRGCRRALLTRMLDALGHALVTVSVLLLGLGLALGLLAAMVFGALGGFAGASFLGMEAATAAALHATNLGFAIVGSVLLAEFALLPMMGGTLVWLEFSPRLDRSAVQRDADAIRAALHLGRSRVALSAEALESAPIPDEEQQEPGEGLKPGLEKLPTALGEVRAVPLPALFLGVLAALVAVGAGAWLMLSSGKREAPPIPAPSQSEAAPSPQSAPVAVTPLPSSSEPALRLVTPPKPRPRPAQSEAQSDEASSADPAASPDASAKETPHTSDEAH